MLAKRCEACGDEFYLTGKHRSSRSYFKKRRFCSAKCAATGSAKVAPIEDRFWAQVERRGADECWEWNGARQKSGYGAINTRGKVISTHRLSWTIHNGPIPNGLHVLHKCDNPPCCNPKHLFLGTPKDNSDDKMLKGRDRHRGLKGTEHHQAKLTDDVVRNIRSSSDSAAEWSRRLSVTTSTIYMIRGRKTWKHVH